MTRQGALALWSYWRRNPLQGLTLVLGLALATALWSGVQALNAEARASYDSAAAVLGEGRFDQILPRAGDRIEQAQYIALRRAGWVVGPVLEGRFQAGQSRIRLVGIDPLTAPGGAGPLTRAGDAPLQRFVSDRAIFAHPAIAEALEAETGLPVIPDPGLAPGTAMTDIGVAQRLLDRAGALSQLIVAPDQPLGRPPLDQIAPDLILRPSQQGADIAQLTDSFHLNLTAFGLLSFAVGIFIVHGAIGLAFEQRRGMLRTLRMLGLPLRRLVLLLLAELLVIALVAGALGVLLGYLLAAALLPDVAATLQGLYGAQVSGSLGLDPLWWLSGLAVAVLGTALAAGGALWRIARMPILPGSGARAWAMAGDRLRGLQAALALVLLAACPALIGLWGGLYAGFAALASLLFGAALALPLVLGALLRGAERRSRSALWAWFWADSRQQLPSLRLALMALLLAMAANIGVSTMVSSFRLTFLGFLDQRLAAELYVDTGSAQQAATVQRIAAGQGDVLPLLSVETRLAGHPADLYGVRVGQTYRDNWQFIAAGRDVWDRVDAGQAVVINEQLARRADLWPGAALDIAPGLRLEVAAVVGDYGNPVGQAVISEQAFAALYPDVLPRRFGLRSDDPAGLRAALEAQGIAPGQITDQAALKAFSQGVFERTFTVTAALNVLTLAVAGFAILMSLLTLAALRVPQLAPVWALGLTRAALGRLELLRAVTLAGLTLGVALPLGLALAWVLLAVVNVEAFGWRLPMYLFPMDYLRLGLAALAAAALAAGWPAWRLARTRPSDLLKVFANDA